MSLQVKAIKAVLSQSNLSATELQDVANHGASGGFSGFIYYTETEAFYNTNEYLINEMLGDYYQEMLEEEIGYDSIFEMISGFGRGGDLEVVSTELIYDEDSEEFEAGTFNQEVVHHVTDYDNMEIKGFAKDTQYKNLMTWFLLEEVARYITDLIEDGEIEEVKSFGVDCSELED